MQRSISRRDFGKLVAGGPALLALQPPWNDWAAAQSLRNELKDLSGELSFDEAVLQAAADDFGHVVHEKPAFMLRPSDAQDIAKAVREPPGSQGRDARPGAFVFRADPGRGRRGHRFQQPEFGPHRLIRRGRDRLARSLWTTPSCSIERCLEPISKSPEEDNEAGGLNKAQEILGIVLPADEDSALPLDPGEEALNEPAAHIAG